MSRKLQFANQKAVSLIFVTAFFFYFSSEALLRQYVLSQVSSKELSVSNILARLPEGIREKVRKRILKGRLQDDLASATTDAQMISALVALASFESEEKLAQTYADIVDKYPSSPYASSAYLFFFKGDSKLKNISIDDFHAYIKCLPEIRRVHIWKSGFAKLNGNRSSTKEVIQFLEPLLDIQPKYSDYRQLYVELAEAGFQEEKKELEARARKKEDSCENLISVEQAFFQLEEKNFKNKKKKKEK